MCACVCVDTERGHLFNVICNFLNIFSMFIFIDSLISIHKIYVSLVLFFSVIFMRNSYIDTNSTHYF